MPVLVCFDATAILRLASMPRRTRHRYETWLLRQGHRGAKPQDIHYSIIVIRSDVEIGTSTSI